MTTPERPSLADTLAHIDAQLADHTAKLEAQPPCLRCARKSLIDSPFCAYHLPCPIDQDAVIAKPRHLPGPPGPTCPGCAARDARPGWLARALNRLFGGAS